jgi:hypothetical protein
MPDSWQASRLEPRPRPSSWRCLFYRVNEKRDGNFPSLPCKHPEVLFRNTQHAVPLVAVCNVGNRHPAADVLTRIDEAFEDLLGQRRVIHRLFQNFLSGFTEAVVDLVVEFTQLNAVLVDQTVEVLTPLLALVSAIVKAFSSLQAA